MSANPVKLGAAFVVVAVLSGCSPGGLTDAEALWDESSVDGYFMAYSVRCGPDGSLTEGVVEIEVSQQGAVSHVGGPRPERLLTVDEMIGLADDQAGADVWLLDYGEFGHPRVIEIDPDLDVAGDEVCVNVWSLIPGGHR